MTSILTMKLEQLATQLLVASGCTPDGRRVEDVDPRQLGFEQKVTYQSAGDHYTWY